MAVDHRYATNGELQALAAPSGLVYWRADARDGWGRVTQETQGNGLVTQRRYSGIFPALVGLQSPVQATGYGYNGLMNLTQRSDSQVSPALTETFGYDNLNRLTQSQVNGLAAITYRYDAIGNLTAKSDVGTLTYPASGQPRPHAVQSAAGQSYGYDANGNQVLAPGRMAFYSSANLPTAIGGTTYTYDAQRRLAQKTEAGTTTHYLRLGNQALLERLTQGTQVTKRAYLYADGRPVALIETQGSTTPTRYLHTDHLGSVSVVTDASGAVVERFSYAAFGQRRNAHGSPNPALQAATTKHGFSGHETLDSVGLIHLGGRVYDPRIGRFLSPDPFIQYPDSTQGLNRYSYVENRPASFVDPNGYGFIKEFFDDFLGVDHWPKGVRVAVAVGAAFVGVPWASSAFLTLGSQVALATGRPRPVRRWRAARSR